MAEMKKRVLLKVMDASLVGQFFPSRVPQKQEKIPVYDLVKN